MQKLPLEGIRALAFSQAWVGPHLTQWLSVMGAEVIKVETNLHLDTERTTYYRRDGTKSGIEQNPRFASLNYGKKDITLNMNLPKAVELVRELVKISDIVFDNFGGPIMERWGLGYADLKKLKPDIIAYSGSGWGRTGPYTGLPAYATIVDSFTGMYLLNTYDSYEPAVLGSSGWTDLITAQHGLFVILAALYHRSKTGEGQFIDCAMSEASANMIAESFMDYAMNERITGATGNRDDMMAPHGCYRCQGKDKWVAIAVSSQEEWVAFCNAIGNPEWTKKVEFSDELSRWQNQEELDKLIGEWTIKHDHLEVMELLQKAGVMAGATLDVVELMNNPHLKERDFLMDIEHPTMGTLHLLRLPWRLSDTPEGNYQRSPLLGEHNDYVFGNLLGLAKNEIAKLIEEKVIY